MDYKQEAEKIVEMYVQIISNEIGYIGAIMRIKETAIQCAIKHVEGMIKHNAKPDEEYWNQILNQLKSM